jgi:serine/threonine protein kinase/Leucine-rich repeat (LRR) protein
MSEADPATPSKKSADPPKPAGSEDFWSDAPTQHNTPAAGAADADADGKADVPVARELVRRGGGEARYEVEQEIARGGMGAILRAVDQDIRREVAIKILLRNQDAVSRQRFMEEARIIGQLEHPNIVPIHELGTDAKGRLFFSMKMVKGKSLAEVIRECRRHGQRQRQQSPGYLLQCLVSVCNAMAFAHAKGVIHRDLKPGNIMLGEFGEVLVMDWGVAKVVAAPANMPDRQTPAAVDAAQAPHADADRELREVVRSFQLAPTGSITQDGIVLGTPLYMPPEQAAGDINAIDERSDIYSLGAMLYEILTLRPPVRGADVAQQLQNVIQGHIIPPDRRAPHRQIPEELAAIAIKAMALKPADRYQTVDALRRDIELHLEGRAVSAKEDTAWETLLKFVRRNRGVSLATGIAGLVLMVALVVNIRDRQRAESSEQSALAARTEAVTNFAHLRQEQAAKEEADQERRALERQIESEGQREWRLVCEEKFDQPQAVAGRWYLLSNRPEQNDPLGPAADFEVKEGALHARNGKPILLILKQPLAGDLAIEFDVRQDSDYLNDASCFMAAIRPPGPKPTWLGLSEAPYTGYQFKHAGFDNAQDVLYRAGGELVRQTATPLVKGVTYHVRAERRDRRLSLQIDGKPVLAVDDPDPLRGPDRDLVGLFGWQAETTWSNIRIYQLGAPTKADVLQLADDHLRRGHIATATDLFRDALLGAAPGQERERKARRGLELAEALTRYARYQVDLQRVWPGLVCRTQVNAMGYAELVLSDNALRDLAPLKGLEIEALDLTTTQIQDLTPLHGMPLRSLKCLWNRIASLEPLRGMSLCSLDISGSTVTDLEPLRGMPLTFLGLAMTMASDLGPLRGMPIRELRLNNSPVRDLAPLSGMPLEGLTLSNNPIDNLRALRGMPLKRLFINNLPALADISALAGAPLSELQLRQTGVTDLKPLRGMPLWQIDLTGTPVSDLAPLKGLRLNSLLLGETRITDLSALVGLPLIRLTCEQTQVADLSPLQGMPLNNLDLRQTQVSDLSPLQGMRLDSLFLSPERIVIGLDLVRNLRSLRFLGVGEGEWKLPAAEFWRQYGYEACVRFAIGRQKYLQGNCAGASEDYRIASGIASPTLRTLCGHQLYDAGDWAQARQAFARQLSEGSPTTSAPYVFFRLLLLDLKQKRPLEEMRARARTWRGQIGAPGWPGTILDFLVGDLDEAALLAAATASGPGERAQERLCEAAFYAASLRLARNDRTGARDLFTRCLATKVISYPEYVSAGFELSRLK